jgi:uncharacterized protein (DUF1330 family)
MSQPGYLLGLGHSLVPEKAAKYFDALPPIHAKYGCAFLGVGGPGRGVELLEGGWFDHALFLARFASPDDVARYWTAPEHEQARELRKDGGVFQAFSLKGVNQDAPMGQPAYLISIYRIFDRPAFQAIAEDEAAMIKARGMFYLARADASEAKRLEGDPLTFDFSIIACPTQASATTLWNDPAYRKIRESRAKATGINTFLMGGLAR